jgi:hypothetical protein
VQLDKRLTELWIYFGILGVNIVPAVNFNYNTRKKDNDFNGSNRFFVCAIVLLPGRVWYG